MKFSLVPNPHMTTYTPLYVCVMPTTMNLVDVSLIHKHFIVSSLVICMLKKDTQSLILPSSIFLQSEMFHFMKIFFPSKTIPPSPMMTTVL